jgi:hypothetical protein
MTGIRQRPDTHESPGDLGTPTRSGRRGGSLTWLTARKPASRNGRGRGSTPYTKGPNARPQRSGSRRATRSPRSAPPRNAMPPRRSCPSQASLAGRRNMPLTAPRRPQPTTSRAAPADPPSGPPPRPGRQVHRHPRFPEPGRVATLRLDCTTWTAPANPKIGQLPGARQHRRSAAEPGGVVAAGQAARSRMTV